MLALLIYLLIINALGLGIMLYDKVMATNNRSRVPETSLLGVAAIGGSLGCLVAMYLVHHKTRHRKFKWGLPAMLIVQIVLFYFIMF